MKKEKHEINKRTTKKTNKQKHKKNQQKKQPAQRRRVFVRMAEIFIFNQSVRGNNNNNNTTPTTTNNNNNNKKHCRSRANNYSMYYMTSLYVIRLCRNTETFKV